MFTLLTALTTNCDVYCVDEGRESMGVSLFGKYKCYILMY